MPGLVSELRVCLACYAAAVLLAVGGAFPSAAQQSGVELKPIRPHAVGLGGYARRGSWTPIRLDLFNESVQARGVICRWLLTDDDGDQVVAERRVDLTPQREQQVWLYANPPLNAAFGVEWTFQVVDADSDELLAQSPYNPPEDNLLPPSIGLVGVCGFQEMGLQHYRRWTSAHERTRVIAGLNLETLPDRWYGLSALSTLVWGPNESGDPADIAMSEAGRQALREWVYRGGHLVVVLPEVGQTWTNSGLADLFAPLDTAHIRQVEAHPPLALFGSLKRSTPITMNTFVLPENSGYSTVAEVQATQAQGETTTARPLPVIVSRRYGFGQVTLVGINLAASDISQWTQPFNLHRVWPRVLGWRAGKSGALFSNDELNSNPNRFREVKDYTSTNRYALGGWVGNRVARQTTAGPAIGLAILLFIFYWVVALTSFPALLRRKGWDRYSWLVFLGVIVIFSTIAWGGASLLRPAKTSATHFTVLDIDGRTDVAHARSWVSLFVPRFASVSVASPSDGQGILPNGITNVISSPGTSTSLEGAGYADPQTYAFDTTEPDRVGVPIRATTKPLSVDFLGYISEAREGLDEPFVLPRGSGLALGTNGMPTGTITHQFDQALTDVLVIYCPGGSGRANDNRWKPLVWRYKNPAGQNRWEPGVPLVLPANAADGTRLWHYPNQNSRNRNFGAEGFLGAQINSRGFRPSSGSTADVVYDISLLSFYDAMPPPLIERDGGRWADFANYQRTVLRDIDLSALTHGRRLILIGHLREGRCPVPLSADGQSVPSDGWTVVRWIYDF